MAQKLRRIRVLARRIVEDELALSRLRDELRNEILAAYHLGATMQQIGDAAGISRQRVSQIIDDRKA